MPKRAMEEDTESDDCESQSTDVLEEQCVVLIESLEEVKSLCREMGSLLKVVLSKLDK